MTVRKTAETMSQSRQKVANYMKSIRSAHLSDDPFEDGKRAASDIMAIVAKKRAAAA